MSKKVNDFSISNTVERKKYNDFYNDFIFNPDNEEMQIDSFLDFVRHYDILEDEELIQLETIIKSVEDVVYFRMAVYDKKLLTKK